MTQLQSTATKQDVCQQALQDTSSMEPEQRQARILELLENAEDPDYYIRLQQETVAAEDSDTTAFAYPAAGEEPNNYWQAVKGPGGSFWKDAADKEYDSLVSNNTWELVTPPPGAPIIGSMWRFKVKRGELGQILKYKARMCARGDQQAMGIDYNETFAPTVRYFTIRALLALACSYDLEVDQFDVITAFLTANVQETILMSQPEG